MWKQPIPTEISELRDNPFAETVFQLVLLHCSNVDREVKLEDGTTVSLKRGQCLFGRFKFNQKLGLPKGSQKVEKELKKSQFLNRWVNRSTYPRYSILTVINYDEWVSIEQVVKQHPNSTQTAPKQHPNTNKSDKSVKNEKVKEIKHTFSWFQKNREALIARAQEKYPEKDARKCADEFEEGIQVKGYKYEDHWLAYLKWLRDDRFGSYKRSPRKPGSHATPDEIKKMIELQFK